MRLTCGIPCKQFDELLMTVKDAVAMTDENQQHSGLKRNVISCSFTLSLGYKISQGALGP